MINPILRISKLRQYKILILTEAVYGAECLNFSPKNRIGKIKRKVLRKVHVIFYKRNLLTQKRRPVHKLRKNKSHFKENKLKFYRCLYRMGNNMLTK